MPEAPIDTCNAAGSQQIQWIRNPQAHPRTNRTGTQQPARPSESGGSRRTLPVADVGQKAIGGLVFGDITIDTKTQAYGHLCSFKGNIFSYIIQVCDLGKSEYI